MLVNATTIAGWAGTKEAQGLLPMLVRRLVFASGSKPSQQDFPASDSTVRPGWDGEVKAEASTAWVVKGRSCWELSCEAQPTKKANKDYKARTKNTPRRERASATFVAVSARRWSTKKKWAREKAATRGWASVRAYDADDLEQWIEQCAPVALWFGETLGLAGPGVESPGSYWAKWAAQSDPAISPDALFVDRQPSVEAFIGNIRDSLTKSANRPLALSADSVEEATAFACAAVLGDDSLATKCLVVTSEEGWRFIEANAGVHIALAARPEVATRPPRRGDIVLVVPYPAADMAAYYGGAAGRERDADISLKRPRRHEFEKALVSLGLDEAEAGRLAASTGRSWSVWRRQRALNPAIRKPAWLDSEKARSLVTVCLLGTWSGAQPGDRQTVERLAGRSYDDLERDLRELAQVDDPPVLEIGEVWKAKSPIELFDLFAGRITTGELDLFFEVSREILEAPDPVLELPADDRFAAAIHGKTRTQSSLLIGAICDGLIKLAVRGPSVPSLLTIDIEGRVQASVRGLLRGADGTRWLSVSPHLQALAEAAPEALLQSVEESLDRSDAPVTRLITETNDSGVMGRCWHAELLWALELLAWSPRHLSRVVLVLARLCHTELKGNWGNKPLGSLVGVFRSWLPQTAAGLEERIALLDKLIDKDPDVAFDLLNSLSFVDHDAAFPAARPKWRDDDTGAGHGVSRHERWAMISATRDRLLQCAKGDTSRVARLLERFDAFEVARQQVLLEVAKELATGQANNAQKETLRGAVRDRIHWYRSRSELASEAADEQLQPWEQLYAELTPSDPVAKHRWLFADCWPRLLSGVSKVNYEANAGDLAATRSEALNEIFAREGMQGVERMAGGCPGEAWVGTTIPALGRPIGELADWLVERGGDFSPGHALHATIVGLLRSLPNQDALALIGTAHEKATLWTPEHAARFLTLANPVPEIWAAAASWGEKVAAAYWSLVPRFWSLPGDADPAIPVRRLLDAGRARTAFVVCEFDFEKVSAPLLAEVLEHLLKGDEEAGRRPDPWHIERALERLEKSGAIEPDRLVLLEFWLIPLLGFEGENQARALYQALTSQPKFFVELLTIVYKPAHEERSMGPAEGAKAAAEIAWHVLSACRLLPGSQADGTIDVAALRRFVDEARELCRGLDRLSVCDLAIGEILAHAPADPDGTWPCGPVRDLLDQSELREMRQGFATGTFNKRGVTSRAYDEGGSQERELAAELRRFASALHESHPNVAAVLDDLAQGYQREGTREDLEAQLRLEGH
jgi:hypothetical protein